MTQSRFSRTVSYFTVWGLIYGLLFGLIMGALSFTMPILQLCACEGSQFRIIADAQFFSLADARVVLVLAALLGMIGGGCLGPFFGGIQGVIAGILVALVSRETKPGEDLDAYGKRLGKYVGYFLCGIYAVILLLFYLVITRRVVIASLPSNLRIFTITTGFVLEMAIAALLPSLLAMRTYPHWIAQDEPINSPFSRLFVLRHQMETNFHILRHSVQGWQSMVIAVIIGYIVVLTWPDLYTTLRSPLEWAGVLGLIIPASLITFWVARVYVSLVTVVIVAITKAAYIEYYAPQMRESRARIVMTMSTFVFVLLFTWWMLWLAPLWAFVMAYYVYQRVELDNDKAKRKEAASAEPVSA